MKELLPLPAVDQACGHVAADFLSTPAERSHFVQFYEEEPFLYETVARFFRAGLTAGDRLLLIGTAEHAQGIVSALGQEQAASALSSGQLTVVDARTMLDSFLVDDMPESSRFRVALEQLLLITQLYRGTRLRAFGEMVDLLWRAGNGRAALRLEELWNEAAQLHEFSLLCACDFGQFREQRDAERFDLVCHLHTHVIPTEGFSLLGDADARLREVSVLQQRALALESEVRQRQAAEGALHEMLARRARVEAGLRASLEREQQARACAQANDAFKEMFMGALGDDLRDSLNTILTTARLMASRDELAPEGQRRLDRVVTSGVRMQRMIEQILDMARDRLTAGISVSRTPLRDLLPLVAKIVEELRRKYPQHRIELHSEGRCTASVDADRFEQVVSNLVGNAATHGDAARPILIAVRRQGANVSLRVRNYGRPIAAQLLALLFEPFRRVRKPEATSEGLGLGLYICERILRAHGGTLRAESSEEQGTLFEAIFPRESGAPPEEPTPPDPTPTMVY